MAADLSAFLAAYSIAFDGDVVTGTWSIGGPLPANLLSGVIGVPQGDGYSHNNYEGDTSITRCDAYTNGGDAHSSSMTRFATAFEYGLNDNRYTLDKFAQLYAKNTHRSIQQNSLYFAPLFSTTLVSPAAYNFIINFMSNHTAAEPAGYLDQDMFKSWFGVSGTYPNFYWERGQERIPEVRILNDTPIVSTDVCELELVPTSQRKPILDCQRLRRSDPGVPCVSRYIPVWR